MWKKNMSISYAFCIHECIFDHSWQPIIYHISFVLFWKQWYKKDLRDDELFFVGFSYYKKQSMYELLVTKKKNPVNHIQGTWQKQKKIRKSNCLFVCYIMLLAVKSTELMMVMTQKREYKMVFELEYILTYSFFLVPIRKKKAKTLYNAFWLFLLSLSLLLVFSSFFFNCALLFF